MELCLENMFLVAKWIVIFAVFGQGLPIYVPNEIDQTPKPYTTGLKIKTSQYKTLSEPYYHSNYSKVYVHNRNYTSSLLDSANNVTKSSSYGQYANLYPVYISEEKKEKIKNLLKEQNTNVVEKDTLNNRVVYKRRIEKTKNIEVYNKCPQGASGQFVYDLACNQYLDCWSGRGGPRNCAPGTLFNPKTLECDFPEKVECLTGPTAIASSLILQKSAKLQNYEQAKCPKDFSGLIPNYTDCTKFIQCNNGIQTPSTCPPGTLFDINLNVCNHPHETTCFSGQSSTGNVAKEQFGGSSDITGHNQSQTGQHQGLTGQYHGLTGQYQGLTGQYQGQTGQYQGLTGQYQGLTGQYQGQTGQYQGLTGQHQGQTGQYQGAPGQYHSQNGHYGGGSGQYGHQSSFGASQGQFLGQTNYLESDQSREGRQYYQTRGCDPTSPYCNSGGYVISGQHIYRNPQVTQGSTKAVGSGTASNFGRGSQFYGGSVQSGGCNPQTQNCQQGTATLYGQSSSSQTGTFGGQSQSTKFGTVYIQYVLCNPAVEDCSNFQQGTFILGPGGTLCNPAKQNCNASQYVPSSKMHAQTGSSSVPSSGVYYVKYLLCNPVQEDCSKYQKGIVEATYGVPGTPTYGVHPVGVTSQGTGSNQISANCNPQIYNCDTIHYQGQSRTQIPTYGHSSNSQDQLGQICNPQYQNCAQGSQSTTSGQTCNPQYQNCDQSKTGRGFGLPSYGQGTAQTGFQGRYPNQKFNTSTNYKKICSAGDENCYQVGSGTATKTYGGHKDEAVEPKCPEGFQGITKHPKSCNKFLNCANGITFVQDCAPGTLFNRILSICDFPYNVDCKDDDQEEPTTTEDSDIVYDQIQAVRTTPKNTTCQGYQCVQNQGFQGQYDGGSQTHTYGQTGCQGSQCYQGQVGQGHLDQTQYGQTGCQGTECYQNQFGQNQFGQQPGQSGCQGINCGYKPQGQDQDSTIYGQHQGQIGGNYGNQQTQGGCQGLQCLYKPQGGLSTNQGQTQGEVFQGYTTPSSQGQGFIVSTQDPTTCQGYQCRSGKDQAFQGQHPVDEQGQVEDYGDQANQYYDTTTQRAYSRPTQVFRRPGNQGSSGTQGSVGQDSRNDDSHIMKIPSKTGYPQVTPINKSDRVTSGGFNNQRSLDYVDIFNPDESRNFAYATTTPKSSRKPEKQVWPPPFPDVATTDPDADYIFEYEDGEPVTLAPEKVNTEKRKKTRCGTNDFVCNQRSCVAKNFVCDGVRDCDDGKDEKYCQKYLDEFKPYKNSRLDVLEKQRWDNVTVATCALLCMDSQKFECKSFNYRKVDRVCFLTNENVGSSGNLKNYYPCDYYERTSMSLDCTDMHKCPNGKCLKSNEVCDGYDDCGDRADERGCKAADFGYQVRLAGGKEENEGRVEVTVFGKTGYICDDQFSITDANVLCKELGFYLGAAEVKGNSYYARDLKENHTLYMMDDLHCIGNESSLMHCDFPGWGIHNCADREIAGVVCKTPEETCGDGFWKCDNGNECVSLPFLCDDLDDCTDLSDEASHHCDLPTAIRLVNGTRYNEGRLEIRHHGVWGSVCDDDFNEDAAKIVCGILGYGGSAYVKKDAYFGKSTGPIWLDQVSCYGNETSIEKCTHWEWGSHNCDHSEDVGVICSNELLDVDAQRSSKAVGGGSSSSIKNSGTTSYSPEPVSCGYRKDNIFLENDDVHFRVVQGSLAKPGDYPWQAALRFKGQGHWCGAVVIASKWVLTAAHCLEGYSKGLYVVVAGEYNINEDEGTEQQAFIEEYYLHEHFREGHKMGNDIAMIKLKGNGFKLNQDIQPICLPDETSDYERDLNCTISGFGTIQTGKSVYSPKLRAAWIPIQKMDVCKMAHIYGENIAEGMICAGNLNGGVDACDGDSGGPLACLEDGLFTLYGLTSWGQRCGYANKPGVYVKVSHYKKWIENIMKLHS